MKEISINSNFTVFDSIEDLPSEVAPLVQSAKNIRKTAYSKYSSFLLVSLF